MQTISSKVSILQNGLRAFFYQFSVSINFLWLLPNIEKKRISLNDSIFGCKNSSVTKDLSKIGSFLLNVPKYLDTKLFYSLYAQTPRIF